MLEYTTRHPPLLLAFHCFKNVNSVYAIAPPLVTCALGALRGTKWTITTILCLLFTFVRGAARGRERDTRKKRPSYLRRNNETRETFEPKDLRKIERRTFVSLRTSLASNLSSRWSVGLVSPLKKRRISIAFWSHFDVNSKMTFRRCCVIRNPRYRPTLLSVRREILNAEVNAVSSKRKKKKFSAKVLRSSF